MRQLGIAHIGAVFSIIGAQHLAVGGDNLGGQVGAWVFEFVEGRHGAENAFGDAKKEQDDQEQQHPEDNPQVADGLHWAILLLRIILVCFHILLFFNVKTNVRDAL